MGDIRRRHATVCKRTRRRAPTTGIGHKRANPNPLSHLSLFWRFGVLAVNPLAQSRTWLRRHSARLGRTRDSNLLRLARAVERAQAFARSVAIVGGEDARDEAGGEVVGEAIAFAGFAVCGVEEGGAVEVDAQRGRRDRTLPSLKWRGGDRVPATHLEARPVPGAIRLLCKCAKRVAHRAPNARERLPDFSPPKRQNAKTPKRQNAKTPEEGEEDFLGFAPKGGSLQGADRVT